MMIFVVVVDRLNSHRSIIYYIYCACLQLAQRQLSCLPTEKLYFPSFFCIFPFNFLPGPWVYVLAHQQTCIHFSPSHSDIIFAYNTLENQTVDSQHLPQNAADTNHLEIMKNYHLLIASKVCFFLPFFSFARPMLARFFWYIRKIYLSNKFSSTRLSRQNDGIQMEKTNIVLLWSFFVCVLSRNWRWLRSSIFFPGVQSSLYPYRPTQKYSHNFIIPTSCLHPYTIDENKHGKNVSPSAKKHKQQNLVQYTVIHSPMFGSSIRALRRIAYIALTLQTFSPFSSSIFSI